MNSIEENYKKYLETRLDLIFDVKKRIPKGKYEYQIEECYEENGISDRNIQTTSKDGLEYVCGPAGERLSKNGYYHIYEFKNGRAAVKRSFDDYKYNFITYHGNLISGEWFDEITSFGTNFALVKRKNKENDRNEYNFIDKNGNMLFDKWLTYVSCLVELWTFDTAGLITIRNNVGQYNLVSTEGKVICDTWFNDMDWLDYGVWTVVKNNGRVNAIDFRGRYLFKNDFKDYEDLYNKYNNLVKAYEKNRPSLYDEYIEYDRNMRHKKVFDINILYRDQKQNCNYNKLPFGKYNATCSPKISSKFKFDYIPIYVYDGYVLCKSENGRRYLYDMETGIYEFIGYGDTYNNEYFIYGHHHVYFMYEGKKIEIADYHSRKLNDADNLKINTGINIMSIQEFETFMRERHIGYEASLTISMMGLKEKEEYFKKTKQKEFNELLKTFQVNANKLNELKNELGNITFERVKIDEVLVEKENHKEVVAYLKPYLRFVDLSLINFKNVDLEGLDLRDTNINLYPQEVYKKSLRDCNLEGINLTFMNLDGVDIRGAKLSYDNDPHTIDVVPNFKRTIYDENTRYNGTPIEEWLKPKLRMKKDQH